MKLEWYVLYHDFNAREIRTWNVFDHYGFLGDCKKAARKYTSPDPAKCDRGAFFETARRSLAYYYWSKCEWEVVVCGWPPSYKEVEAKIDVYDQVMMNWRIFCDYLWSHTKELRKREKKHG